MSTGLQQPECPIRLNKSTKQGQGARGPRAPVGEHVREARVREAVRGDGRLVRRGQRGEQLGRQVGQVHAPQSHRVLAPMPRYVTRVEYNTHTVRMRHTSILRTRTSMRTALKTIVRVTPALMATYGH